VSSALAAIGIAQSWDTQGPMGNPDLSASALVAMAALVPLLGWVWVARRNAGLLAPGHRFRFGPLTAAIAVAGPVSHLWWARPVLLEIATASAPPGQSAAAARLVRSWWACLIGGVGSLLLQRALTLLGYRGFATHLPVWAELVLRSAPVFLLPVAAVQFAVLVRRIGRWQHGGAPAAGPVTAPPDAGAVRPLSQGTAVACGLVTVVLLATPGIATLVQLSDVYLLPAGRPGAQWTAAGYLITATAVFAAVARLVLQPPAGSRVLVTALCWAALLGLLSPALPRIPDDWDVAGGLLLIVSALAGLVAADRVDRCGVSRRRRSWAG
jgi:hypothetical protein